MIQIPDSSTDRTSPIIEVHNLWRSFGNFDAVRGIHFSILPGQVVGFIGANGAGKTTTMRILATLELPTAGSVKVCGHDVVTAATQVRRKVGWMPDFYGAYPNTTVREYLDFFVRAYGYTGEDRLNRVNEVMAFTELDSLADKGTHELSKGMGQRLCLGRTLLHDPQILILDEPAAGLDPKARREFKHLVRVLAEQGKTIFISSHILSELSEMCNELLFIDQGRIIHQGSAEDLQRHAIETGVNYHVELAADHERFLLWAALEPGMKIIESVPQGARLHLKDDDPQAIAAVLRRIIEQKFAVTGFHPMRTQLEDSFVEILNQFENQKGDSDANN